MLLLRKQIKQHLSVSENQSNNKVEITVKPQKIGIEAASEIHLVGEMNNWNPEDKNYSLNKEKNGCWINNFNLEAGTEYKIKYI